MLQVITIASHGGGSKNLLGVLDMLEPLKAVGFNPAQIVQVVSHDGGSKNLKAVGDNLSVFRHAGFTAEQVFKLALIFIIIILNNDNTTRD